jgi:hypothetical protein
LKWDFIQAFSLDHLEAVEIGVEVITGVQVGGQAHSDLRVVEVTDVHLVVDLQAGAIGA